MIETRYSESPESDIWNRLLKYSYKSNIERNSKIIDDKLINSITSSILQANEYYIAAENVTLNIKPLLMYYGTVNLLYFAAMLIGKQELIIKNHGATLHTPEGKGKIGDIEIQISGSLDGAFAIFNKIFFDDNKFPKAWKIKDTFSYIPDLKQDFNECYLDSEFRCIPIETIKRRQDKIDRIKRNDIQDDSAIDRIVDFSREYLNAQITNDYIILREKIKSIDIGTYSISGQKYLINEVEIGSNKYHLNQLMSFFLGLYSLSVLSRYHPALWYEFIQKDETGERSLIENFLSVSARKLPNIILDLITGKEIRFLPSITGYIDLSKDYDPEDVRRIAREEYFNCKDGL